MPSISQLVNVVKKSVSHLIGQYEIFWKVGKPQFPFLIGEVGSFQEYLLAATKVMFKQ